jgi:hypothetical protein
MGAVMKYVVVSTILVSVELVGLSWIQWQPYVPLFLCVLGVAYGLGWASPARFILVVLAIGYGLDVLASSQPLSVLLPSTAAAGVMIWLTESRRNQRLRAWQLSWRGMVSLASFMAVQYAVFVRSPHILLYVESGLVYLLIGSVLAVVAGVGLNRLSRRVPLS